MTQVPRRSARRVALRILLALVLIIFLAAAAAGAWFWHAAHAALPQVEGEIRIAGLNAPVRVLRDAQGVPHITAANAEDLFFAQGYVTAQDRLWQMDMSRRYAAGELSEILGPQFLRHDREQRILGVRQVGERSLAALSARDRAQWEAYARGVNTVIEQQRDHLPIEFRLLRYQPRQWTLLDSFLCGGNLAQALNHGLYLTEILRGRVTEKLGPELAPDLYPNQSWRDIPPGKTEKDWDVEDTTPGGETTKRLHHGGTENTEKLFGLSVLGDLRASVVNFDVEDTTVAGSNNWVVSGAHTASGKPLLANDMHLFNTVPNTWYEAHLRIAPGAGAAATFDVAGVTLPGMPYVIMGHNQRIAWGYTNLGPAVQDVYIENVNSRGEYETPRGWQRLTTRDEVIHVKGQPDVHLQVRSTRHGPIVTELVPGETRALALRWVIYEQPLTAPFFDINAAQNWPEFRAAFAQYNGPSQNVVYADVDGHIGYQATGKIPTRATGDGSVPVAGNDDAHEWTGFVAFEQLPSVFDPPSGMIATANGRITPDDYPVPLSNQWGPPYRTERIYRVLRSKPRLTAADMLALQNDVYSELDRFCGERFVYAVDRAPNASARAREATNLMRGWNGWVTKDAVAPSVVVAVRRQLWRLLLEPKLGAAAVLAPNSAALAPGPSGWQQYQWFMSTVAMENLLMRQPARWLPAGFQTWNDLLVAAVEAAVKEGASGAPTSLATWQWGRAHPLELNHPVFGQVPLLQRWTGPGVRPQSGDGTTVKQVGRSLGPSERMATDFADLDASYLNIVTGQSGQLFGEHYNDQWDAWYSGTRSFPLAFTPAAVDKAARHRLVLKP
jgi:penicillin amidase